MNNLVSFETGLELPQVGKRVGESLYLHASLLDALPPYWRQAVTAAQSIADVADADFDVVKFHKDCRELSLLNYSGFFDDPFPALSRSWRVSLQERRVTFRSYEESRNPPILHRKELLLASEHERIGEYKALTEAAERIGLFDDPTCIGFREYWYRLIAEHGYELIGGEFVPAANADSTAVSDEPVTDTVQRHLTALSRANFSAPVQALTRHALLRGDTTFFDYGCGRGDDVRSLKANGFDAIGWDPHYAPDIEKREADVVNIGFVINVIDDVSERIEALRAAYGLTRGVMAVAAMLVTQAPPDGRPYRDGYLSSRNTFQKYFTQAQLRDFIEHSLDETSVAVAPGVFFVFRDKSLEQRFLAARYGHKRTNAPPRYWRPEAASRGVQKIDRAALLFEQYRSLLEPLCARILERGRPLVREELPPEEAAALEGAIGSFARAMKTALAKCTEGQVNRARAARMSDLVVMLGLQQFQKRKPYRALDVDLQRDVRHFFGDYRTAQETARATLFELSNPVAIDAACRDASQHGFGWLEEGQSLQLHVDLLERLPTILRIYVGASTVIYGDISQFDLVKIHIRSGKISLLKFDDFENAPLPRLIQRVKVNLRDQDVDIFDYGGAYPAPLLYGKSRFINEEFARYAEQVTFEEALESLQLFDMSGYGPPEAELVSILVEARWEIDGFTLQRSQSVPPLDARCGPHFTYRDLIECGETQTSRAIDNVPRSPDTYTALYDLATKVLDPIIDYFGMIKLTFGFCSHALAKQIKTHIAPKLDQHAAHERNTRGKYICERLGAACDFLVQDEDMREVAKWVVEHTPCDRVYVYDPSRPIHVSYSDTPARQLVEMHKTRAGRLVPRIVR